MQAETKKKIKLSYKTAFMPKHKSHNELEEHSDRCLSATLFDMTVTTIFRHSLSVILNVICTKMLIVSSVVYKQCLLLI